MIGLAFITLLVHIPDIHFLLVGKSIPNAPIFPFNEKISIILTFAISMFAAVEGYSTYMHVVLADKRNRIEDARNELEKAYGPLYTVLNKFAPFTEEEKSFELSQEEKSLLDKTMATYPFMFPSEIYDYWRQNIQNLGPYAYTSNLQPAGYEIYMEFRDKINEEYDRKVKEYNELLGK